MYAGEQPIDSFPLRVCSHRRSGTHFLMASIYQNFHLDKKALMNSRVEVRGQTWHTGEEKAAVPWCHLQGVHDMYDQAVKKLPPQKILYIVRHPVDCLYALYRFWGKGDADSWISDTRIARWLRHAKGYTENVPYFIRYEDLKDPANTQEIFSTIAEVYNLIPVHSEYTLVDHLVGWSPKEGLSGYSDRLNDDTLARFRRLIPEGFLGYEI